MAYDASTLPDVSGLTVGIIGGTGDQGRGLAYRFARAGQTVLIGSRSAERAAESAAEIAALPGVPASGSVTGAANDEVARRSDVVIIAVPW
ncbi:NAD(P)-binding domain-containing protein, partial [Micromonospora sp. M51]